MQENAIGLSLIVYEMTPATTRASITELQAELETNEVHCET